MRGIARDCVQELVDRKSIWIYAVLTVISALIIMGLRSVKVMEGPIGSDAAMSPLAEMGSRVTLSGMDSFLSLLVFVTVFVTAGLLVAGLWNFTNYGAPRSYGLTLSMKFD